VLFRSLHNLEDCTLEGEGIDLSVDARGMGFLTPHPQFTGRKLLLLPGDVAGIAEVRWVGTAPVGYRVGIAVRPATDGGRE
jgi:hypothetical protein